MILDSDAVRDILLVVESCSYNEVLRFSDLCKRLPAYPEDSLAYACEKLKESGYLEVVIKHFQRTVMIVSIKNLTAQGHEFLNTIRDNGIWTKTKSVAAKVGVFSLKSLAEIGGQIAAAAIQSALQLL